MILQEGMKLDFIEESHWEYKKKKKKKKKK